MNDASKPLDISPRPSARGRVAWDLFATITDRMHLLALHNGMPGSDAKDDHRIAIVTVIEALPEAADGDDALHNRFSDTLGLNRHISSVAIRMVREHDAQLVRMAQFGRDSRAAK